ncbi:MAG: protease modulator HflC [Pseudomonadota bacterium]
MRILPIIGVIIVITGALLYSSLFRVDERQKALVLQFGEVKEVATDPGLYIKIPLIQEVAFYDARIQTLETSELEVTPRDNRRLVVDAFALWRVDDVVRFRQRVATELNAANRLDSIVDAKLREVLGQVDSADVLSPERTVLMTRIRDTVRSDAKEFGVDIVDVRIRRADLPEQNLAFTFDRMNAERKREAADERARGKERAQEVRATADRQAVELVSDAEREAQVIRGEADAERNKIYAQAFGKDAEFFSFYRSLQAYERALKGQNSTMVISPNGEFFDYLKNEGGRPAN